MFLTIVAIVVGAMLGAAIGEGYGAASGAAIGWLVRRSRRLADRIVALEQALGQWKAPAIAMPAAEPVVATLPMPLPRAVALSPVPATPAAAPSAAAIRPEPASDPLAPIKAWLFGGNTI